MEPRKKGQYTIGYSSVGKSYRKKPPKSNIAKIPINPKTNTNKQPESSAG